jgi:hypothetical protein
MLFHIMHKCQSIPTASFLMVLLGLSLHVFVVFSSHGDLLFSASILHSPPQSSILELTYVFYFPLVTSDIHVSAIFHPSFLQYGHNTSFPKFVVSGEEHFQQCIRVTIQTFCMKENCYLTPNTFPPILYHFSNLV